MDPGGILECSDDYIDFASRRIDLSNGFTLESWFKTPGGTSDMILFSSRNPIDNELEVEVYLSANAEEISVNYFEQAISTVEEVNDNLWHHWAITVDTVENQIAVYIDGSLDKGSASLLEIDEDATRDITVVSEFRFANGLTNEDANLLGYIDEVISAEKFMDRVMEKANELASLPHPFYANTKKSAQEDVREKIAEAIKKYEQLTGLNH